MDLNNIEKFLNQILSNQVEMQKNISNLQNKVDKMETKMDKIESDIKELKSDVKIIFDQTVNLTEFKTEVMEKLYEIVDNLEFIKHKEYQNEKEIYDIKRRLRSAK